MPSRSLHELGFIAAQALLELLPLWMVYAVIQSSVQKPPAWSFLACWLLLLSAAGLAWSSRRWKPRALYTAGLLLLAAGVGLLLWLWLTLAPSELMVRRSGLLALNGPWRLDAAGLMWTWILGGYLSARGLLIGRNAGRAGELLRWFVFGLVVSVLLFAFLALSGAPSSVLPLDELRGLCLTHVVLGTMAAGLDQRTKLQGLQPSATTPVAAWVAVGVPLIAVLTFSLLVSYGVSGIRWFLGASMLIVRSGLSTGRWRCS